MAAGEDRDESNRQGKKAAKISLDARFEGADHTNPFRALGA